MPKLGKDKERNFILGKSIKRKAEMLTIYKLPVSRGFSIEWRAIPRESHSRVFDLKINRSKKTP